MRLKFKALSTVNRQLKQLERRKKKLLTEARRALRKEQIPVSECCHPEELWIRLSYHFRCRLCGGISNMYGQKPDFKER